MYSTPYLIKMRGKVRGTVKNVHLCSIY